MSTEKMRVLELLESGKINAEEAAKLIEAIGASYSFMSKDTRENVEERLNSFGKDVGKFAKDIGCKIQEYYKEVEPKIKKASQQALEKCASALDNLAHSVGDSIEKDCCTDEKCVCPEADASNDNEPKSNGPKSI